MKKYFIHLKCFPLYWESETETRVRIHVLNVKFVQKFNPVLLKMFHHPIDFSKLF